jgi:hypothetical protein
VRFTKKKKIRPVAEALDTVRLSIIIFEVLLEVK